MSFIIIQNLNIFLIQTMKNCPFCNRPVEDNAVRCSYQDCGKEFKISEQQTADNDNQIVNMELHSDEDSNSSSTFNEKINHYKEKYTPIVKEKSKDFANKANEFIKYAFAPERRKISLIITGVALLLCFFLNPFSCHRTSSHERAMLAEIDKSMKEMDEQNKKMAEEQEKASAEVQRQLKEEEQRLQLEIEKAKQEEEARKAAEKELQRKEEERKKAEEAERLERKRIEEEKRKEENAARLRERKQKEEDERKKNELKRQKMIEKEQQEEQKKQKEREEYYLEEGFDEIDTFFDPNKNSHCPELYFVNSDFSEFQENKFQNMQEPFQLHWTCRNTSDNFRNLTNKNLVRLEISSRSSTRAANRDNKTIPDFSKLSGMIELKINDCILSRETFVAISKLPNLKHLILFNCHFNSEDFKLLASTKLTKLLAFNCSPSDIETMAKIKTLETLIVSIENSQKVNYSPLSSLPNLTFFSDRSLRLNTLVISGFPKVRSLKCDNCPKVSITDCPNVEYIFGLAGETVRLRNLPKLIMIQSNVNGNITAKENKTAYLEFTNIDCANIPSIPEFTFKKTLDVHFEQMDHVTTLHLKTKNVSNVLEKLPVLPNLKVVSIEEVCTISKKGFEYMAKCNRLKTIAGEGIEGITDDDIKILSENKSITTLYFPGEAISDTGYSYLLKMPQLINIDFNYRAIKFSCPPKVTDSTLEILGKIKKLQTLSLPGKYITDAGMEHIVNLPELKVIKLGNVYIQKDMFKKIAHMPNISLLVLSLAENKYARDDPRNIAEFILEEYKTCHSTDCRADFNIENGYGSEGHTYFNGY